MPHVNATRQEYAIALCDQSDESDVKTSRIAYSGALTLRPTRSKSATRADRMPEAAQVESRNSSASSGAGPSTRTSGAIAWTGSGLTGEGSVIPASARQRRYCSVEPA